MSNNARMKHLPAAEQVHSAQQQCDAAEHQHQQQHRHQCPNLPDAVLTAILQHVHLRHRLSACALVCKSWAAAVALTTADATAFLSGPDSCRHMQDWLHLWGEKVSNLDLYYSIEALKEGEEEPDPSQCSLLLPCSKLTMLTQLCVSRIPIVLHTQQDSSGPSTRSKQRASTAQSLVPAAAASSSGRGGGSTAKHHQGLSGPAAAASAAAAGGSAPFMPALRELYLSKNKVQHKSFLQLSQLTGLTNLRLYAVMLSTAAWAPASKRQARKAFTAVLQQLQGLQVLEMQDFVLHDPAAALAPLSTMQRLQRLSLSTDACSTAALAHLPTSLTSLELRGYEDDWDDGMSYLSVMTSSLKQLPLLCAVHLTCLSLGPDVLAGLTRLTQLSISDVLLEPAGGEYDEDMDIRDEFQMLQSVFLSELGKLTQLQDVSLHHMDLSNVPDAQQLTALTASSQLQQLVVTQPGRRNSLIRYNNSPLPRRALKHMFSSPKQWPSLQTLRLEVPGPDDNTYGDAEDWCVDASDVMRLAACLPALASLSLIHVVEDTVRSDTAAALPQLMPCLTHLSVAGGAFDDTAAGAVAQLTSLVELEWSDSRITPSGLQQLTALTNLEMLAVSDCPHVKDLEHMLDPEGIYAEAIELYRSVEAREAGRSDVCEQLQELCSCGSQLREAPGL